MRLNNWEKLKIKVELQLLKGIKLFLYIFYSYITLELEKFLKGPGVKAPERTRIDQSLYSYKGNI